MKKIFLLIALVLFVFNASSQDYKQLINEGDDTVDYVSEIAEQHFDSIGRGRGTGYKQFRRWQYFAERAMDESGKLKSPEFYYNELENYNASVNNEGLAARTTVGTWEEMGPTYWNATSSWSPGVGRVTSIAVDETNLDHIIIGGETGGVWKTMDGGSTWSVLTDNLSNIDVYALTIDPSNSNTYYWGSVGGTIFKSTNGGSTWSLLADIQGGGRVNKILVDPTNTSKIYASLEGNGLFKSTDGGVTWNSIYFVSTNTGYDLEFKPNNPNTIYASGSGFFVSTDGGNNFIEVTGTDTNQFSDGPKMIGVSPDNPSVVYVLEASGGIFGGFYVSNDSGNTFIKQAHGQNFFGYNTNGNDSLGQAPRDMGIAVNPNDVNDVHIAGINTWRSTDAGVSFSITSQWVPNNASNLGIGYCHADVDILHFAGGGSDAKLYVGTDGGIYKTDDPTTVSANYYTDLTSGLGIRQFYKIGVSQTDPVVVTAGSQDNGTSVLREDGNWTDWLGADGMEGFVDKNNPSIMYGTIQFGAMNKTEYNIFGSNISNITQPDDKGGDSNWNWVVPFEQDPIVQNTIYVAFDEVYKSEDAGQTWVSISPNFGANIDHFKIAPTNNQIMYIAINGTLRYTIDGGISWAFVPLGLSGNTRINEIAIHPTDSSKIAVATTNSEKVYVTTDAGQTWTSMRLNLPNFVAQSLAWQNNGVDGLYVAMNYGVFYTDNTRSRWVAFSNGLPNVRINELEINTADNKLYAATYGRGLWRSNVYDASLSVDDFKFNDFSIYPNPASNEVSLKWNSSEGASVRIFNTLGKLMFYDKKVNLSNSFKIDITSYNPGIYFVKLNSAKGEITKKLIIK